MLENKKIVFVSPFNAQFQIEKFDPPNMYY
jgi:hypothetical protein